jgi:hypothetical protein
MPELNSSIDRVKDASASRTREIDGAEGRREGASVRDKMDFFAALVQVARNSASKVIERESARARSAHDSAATD